MGAREKGFQEATDWVRSHFSCATCAARQRKEEGFVFNICCLAASHYMDMIYMSTWLELQNNCLDTQIMCEFMNKVKCT